MIQLGGKSPDQMDRPEGIPGAVRTPRAAHRQVDSPFPKPASAVSKTEGKPQAGGVPRGSK